MADAAGFLSSTQFQTFQQRDRCLDRQVLPQRGGQQTLLDFCLEGIQRQSPPRFSAFAIAVKPDDGMSWSAERVYQEARRLRPNYACIALHEILGKALPAISLLMKPQQFLRLAANCKLANRFLGPWSFRFLSLLGIVIAAISAYTQLSKLASLPWFWVALALLAAATQSPLAEWRSKRRMQSSEESFQEKFRSTNLMGSDWDNFIQAMVKKMRSTPFPRVIVIDDFEALDMLTQRVIVQYFDGLIDEPPGCEVWCIFEGTTGGTFSTRARLNAKRASAFGDVLCAKQPLLSTDEKLDLIERIGAPADREQFTTIKSVCDSQSLSAEDRLRPLREYQQRDEKQSALVVRFCALLAMAGLGGRR